MSDSESFIRGINILTPAMPSADASAIARDSWDESGMLAVMFSSSFRCLNPLEAL